MRLLLQRVRRASVEIDGEVAGAIGPGLLALAGFAASDLDATLDAMLRKALNLRVFADDEGKMNRSLLETGGALLIVSQFTLYADCRKGRRPSYIDAAPPPKGSACTTASLRWRATRRVFRWRRAATAR
jgi:D-tyrosyl-tRNA(Tyr) deacylase